MATADVIRDVSSSSAGQISKLYSKLSESIVQKVAAEDIEIGKKLFHEHAGGDEDCHGHDSHHDEGECSHGCGHGDGDYNEDDFDPEEENRNMMLPGYRAYWCKDLFVVQAEMVKGAFVVATEKQIVPQSFFKTVKSVTGMGCGPGSDLAGFMEFLEELPENCRPETPPLYIGLDAEEGWREYVEKIDCQFQCTSVDTKALKEMNKSDVIIMCCFASHVGLSKTAPDERNNWDIIAEKCDLLVVLDFDDSALDAALKEREFVSYKLKGDCAVFPGYTLNVYAKKIMQ